MNETERDKNLLVACAVEGCAHRHNMTTSGILKLFREYGVTDAIRRCYGTWLIAWRWFDGAYIRQSGSG